MLNKELGAWVAVISHKRPKNVKPMTALIGPATWYVGGSGDDYGAEGAKFVPSGGLVPSRNAALDDAFNAGVPCLQLDDDLKWLGFFKDKKNVVKVPFVTFAAELVRSTERSQFKLGGVAPTTNAFYYNPNKRASNFGFVIGSFCVALPNNLRFNPAFTLKEDYDYSLQHIIKYGGIHRRNDLTANFQHYTNPGGAVDIRNDATEQQNISLLKKLYPAFIKDNTRRPNEILLKAPR